MIDREILGLLGIINKCDILKIHYPYTNSEEGDIKTIKAIEEVDFAFIENNREEFRKQISEFINNADFNMLYAFFKTISMFKLSEVDNKGMTNFIYDVAELCKKHNVIFANKDFELFPTNEQNFCLLDMTFVKKISKETLNEIQNNKGEIL